MWDVSTGKELATFPKNNDGVVCVAFASDGKTIASAGGWDLGVRLWDVNLQKERRTLTGFRARLHCVAFSPDGKTLASASDDNNSVKLWDTETGKELRSFNTHFSPTHSVALCPMARRWSLAVKKGPCDYGTQLQAKKSGHPTVKWPVLLPLQLPMTPTHSHPLTEMAFSLIRDGNGPTDQISFNRYSKPDLPPRIQS